MAICCNTDLAKLGIQNTIAAASSRVAIHRMFFGFFRDTPAELTKVVAITFGAVNDSNVSGNGLFHPLPTPVAATGCLKCGIHRSAPVHPAVFGRST